MVRPDLRRSGSVAPMTQICVPEERNTDLHRCNGFETRTSEMPLTPSCTAFVTYGKRVSRIRRIRESTHVCVSNEIADRHFGDDCCRIRRISMILMLGKRSAFCKFINGGWNLNLSVLCSSPEQLPLRQYTLLLVEAGKSNTHLRISCRFHSNSL